MASLAERLGRLRRVDDDPPPSLARVEASLALEEPGGLSLKERLERLVIAASRRSERQPFSAPAGVPLEELIAGRRVQNERGEFFLVEEDVHLETFHGDVPLTRFRALSQESVSVMTGEPEMASFDLNEAVFLDTETTGLAGGTGTAAFLIGIGFVDGDRFRVRQYFMRDYHEEAALLHGLSEDIARFKHLVTFNGKAFDIPLLESRFRLSRERYPLIGARHFDLLHPARRLWKARLESCSLQALEVALLGLRRHDDVRGDEIPNIYFDFVRRRDGRAMARVLQHNRLDIVSLAALAALASQWVEDGRAEDPRDVLCLARVYERAQLFERSEEHYRRLLTEAPAVRVPALMRLAAQAKKEGDLSRALPLWHEAAQAGDWWALRELARHHEHRTRDFLTALSFVDRGLDLVRDADMGFARAVADFRRRRERLTGKLAGAGERIESG